MGCEVGMAGGGRRALVHAASSSVHGLPNPFPLSIMQEVRLYVASCLCHILRLSAPDTPYLDEQLQVSSVGAICSLQENHGVECE